MSLWYADCFALKVTETQWAPEKLLLPHPNYLEEFKSEAGPTTRVITRTDVLPLYVAGKLYKISALLIILQ